MTPSTSEDGEVTALCSLGLWAQLGKLVQIEIGDEFGEKATRTLRTRAVNGIIRKSERNAPSKSCKKRLVQFEFPQGDLEVSSSHNWVE
jgi:hypothetical protein